jgi:hypothetical protein
MKKLLLAGLMFASAQAFAQVSVPFNATVSTSCALNVTQNGILVVNPQNPNVMETSGVGMPGTVAVSFTGTPTITITVPTSFSSSPTLSFTPSFSPSVNSSVFGFMSIANDEAVDTYSSGSTDVITISMQITTGGGDPFPVGTYATAATVNCL